MILGVGDCEEVMSCEAVGVTLCVRLGLSACEGDRDTEDEVVCVPDEVPDVVSAWLGLPVRVGDSVVLPVGDRVIVRLCDAVPAWLGVILRVTLGVGELT